MSTGIWWEVESCKVLIREANPSSISVMPWELLQEPSQALPASADEIPLMQFTLTSTANHFCGNTQDTRQERVLRCHSLPRAAHFSAAPTTAPKGRTRHGPPALSHLTLLARQMQTHRRASGCTALALLLVYSWETSLQLRQTNFGQYKHTHKHKWRMYAKVSLTSLLSLGAFEVSTSDCKPAFVVCCIFCKACKAGTTATPCHRSDAEAIEHLQYSQAPRPALKESWERCSFSSLVITNFRPTPWLHSFWA